MVIGDGLSLALPPDGGTKQNPHVPRSESALDPFQALIGIPIVNSL